jgi:O-antigen/teichoic acid export membrane protein
MMLSLPIAAFHSAWGPFSLAIYKERDATATYERVLSLYVFGLSLVLVAMSFAAEPLVWLAASSRYTGAAAVIVPLGCGVVIEAVSWITGIGIDLSKRTHYAALAYVTGLGVTLAALSALVGPFGLIGVAYGTLIGRVAQAAAYTWGGYRAYPLRFSLAGPTTMLAGALLVAVAGTALPLDDGAAMGGARLVLFLLFFSAAWRLSLSADDRAIVVATVRAAVGWTRARTDPTHGPAPPASPVTRAESASPGVRR